MKILSFISALATISAICIVSSCSLSEEEQTNERNIIDENSHIKTETVIQFRNMLGHAMTGILNSRGRDDGNLYECNDLVSFGEYLNTMPEEELAKMDIICENQLNNLEEMDIKFKEQIISMYSPEFIESLENLVYSHIDGTPISISEIIDFEESFNSEINSILSVVGIYNETIDMIDNYRRTVTVYEAEEMSDECYDNLIVKLQDLATETTIAVGLSMAFGQTEGVPIILAIYAWHIYQAHRDYNRCLDKIPPIG